MAVIQNDLSDKIFIRPITILIEKYEYKIKEDLVNNYFSYRCKNRKDCGLVIKVSKDELQKYMENQNYKINFSLPGKKTKHTCKFKEDKEKDKNIDNNYIISNKINKEKKVKSSEMIIKTLIIQNIEKPLKFHVENFKSNNINLSYNQIKWKLQKLREEKLPNDFEYLKDISKIKIQFEKNIEAEEYPLCFKSVEMINPEKNYQLDKYIIFTSKFQINIIPKYRQLLIDGTFKSCPKRYYQIINIAGYYEDIGTIIPIFMIPTSGKSFYLYNKIFKDVKEIIIDNGISLDKIPNRIIIDFEKSLQKSIKTNFPNAKTDGCYFHFVKLLWNKAKKLGLYKKNDLKNTKILLFVLKIIPFLRGDEKYEVFKKIEELFSNNENKYRKMMLYYKKIG